MTRNRTLLSLSLVLATATAALAQPQDVIVGFHGAPDHAAVTKAGGDVTARLDFINATAARVPAEAIGLLKRHPRIRYIEVDRHMHATDASTVWGVRRTDADLVQGVLAEAVLEDGTTTLLDLTSSAKVAILDTGADREHPQLVFSGGKNFVPPSKRGKPRPADPEAWDDDHYHGTHVAGTVGALRDGVGVVGMAPYAQLYIGKVLDSQGSGNLSWLAEAIHWAVDIEEVDIISMSLGWEGGDSQAVRDAMAHAHAAGVLLIVAAGNDGNDGNDVQYPASYPEVMAVGASMLVDGNGDIALTEDGDLVEGASMENLFDAAPSFSSHGYWVDVSAPGVYVRSTYPLELGGEDSISGTSMATPHVAGLAALLKGFDHEHLSSKNLRAVIEATARHPDGEAWDEYFGAGVINAADAFAAISDENGDPRLFAETRIVALDAPAVVAKSDPADPVTHAVTLTVANYGNTAAADVVVTFEGQTQILNLAADAEEALTFAWAPPTGEGTTTLVATIAFAGDIDPDNNTLATQVTVVGALFEDTFEPNDTLATAAALLDANTTNASIQATVGAPGDEDWYRIDGVVDGGRIVVSLTSLPGDYDLRLFDADGNEVKRSVNAGTTSESFNYRARRSTGTYYLQIVGWNGASSAVDPYDLTAEVR
jgi:subtilisin family serine protease